MTKPKNFIEALIELHEAWAEFKSTLKMELRKEWQRSPVVNVIRRRVRR